jgi:hypothetical protein
MKSTIFWDLAPCSLAKCHPSCRGMYGLLEPEVGGKNVLLALLSAYLFCLHFDPEDEEITFLRNIDELLSDCIASHSFVTLKFHVGQ